MPSQGVCSRLCSCDVRVTSQAKFEPKLGREAPPSHDDRYKAAVALAEMVGFEVSAVRDIPQRTSL